MRILGWASLERGVEMGHSCLAISSAPAPGWAVPILAAPGSLDLHLLLCWYRSGQPHRAGWGSSWSQRKKSPCAKVSCVCLPACHRVQCSPASNAG